jgi:hypothetical protein
MKCPDLVSAISLLSHSGPRPRSLVSTSSSSRLRARREAAANHAHARAQGKPPLIMLDCSPCSQSVPAAFRSPVLPPSPLSLLSGSAVGRTCRRRTSTGTCLIIAPGGADGADPVRRGHEGVAAARRRVAAPRLQRGHPFRGRREQVLRPVHPCHVDLCRGRRSDVLNAGLMMDNLLLCYVYWTQGIPTFLL